MEPRQYRFNDSALTIRFGSIIESQAEVIVSSDNNYLTMGGGVSRAIFRAAGNAIAQDTRKMTPVSLGDVVVTSAGMMVYQKYVFHCITIDKTRRMQTLSCQITENDLLDYLIQHSIDKCFHLMKLLNITSIAFPIIGAGAARIPVHKVIEQMTFSIARNLANTNKKIDVELYLYDIYNIISESDYISLFENLAAKVAIFQYKQLMGNSINYDDSTNRNQEMTHQVFISYSRKDKEFVECLCEFLKKYNIEYWIDKEGIYSSFNYKELIVDAIDVSKAIIFLSSESSNSSLNVIREIGYAVNKNKPILPLILDDTQYAKSIRLDISDIDQIDFKNPKNSEKKLLTSLLYVLNK